MKRYVVLYFGAVIMKNLFKTISAALMILGSLSTANAALVTINMTADNKLSGGICADASCQSLSDNWSGLGNMSNANNWKMSDSISFDLMPGVYSFAWLVENTGNASNGNPAGLLVDILSDGNTIFSSNDWEVFDVSNGDLIASATEYGQNGEAGVIWTNANRGPISGISTDANWVYSANNFANAERFTWLRTSFEIEQTANAVSAPATLGFLTIATLFLAYRRIKSA